jgi:hypothetical protein
MVMMYCCTNGRQVREWRKIDQEKWGYIFPFSKSIDVDFSAATRWEAFVAYYEDWGRDLALYLERKQCGLELAKSGRLACGNDYATMSNRIRQFETAYPKYAKLKDLVKQLPKYLDKEKM